MLTTTPYTSDIIFLRIILDELREAHKLVLVFSLQINLIAFIHQFFSWLDGQSIDFIWELIVNDWKKKNKMEIVTTAELENDVHLLHWTNCTCLGC